MHTILVRAVPLVVLIVAFGCGGEEAPAPGGPAANPAPAAGGGPAVGGDLKAQGEALAKEALAEFDRAVDEMAEALKDKPDGAAVLPKLVAIRDAYLPKMEAIAARRKTFTDPVMKGGFYGWMGSNRGKSVFRKDNVLGAFVAHYRFTAASPEVVEFLTTKVVDLIETAHNR